MNKNMYFIHDVVSGEYRGPFMYSTDGEALRDFVKLCKENKEVPVFDLELVNIGITINYDHCVVSGSGEHNIVALGRSVLIDNSEA